MRAKLKTGEIVELPFEDMLNYIDENRHLIEKQPPKLPRNPRLLKAAPQPS